MSHTTRFGERGGGQLCEGQKDNPAVFFRWLLDMQWRIVLSETREESRDLLPIPTFCTVRHGVLEFVFGAGF